MNHQIVLLCWHLAHRKDVFARNDYHPLKASWFGTGDIKLGTSETKAKLPENNRRSQ